jgi:hypothetical protein
MVPKGLTTNEAKERVMPGWTQASRLPIKKIQTVTPYLHVTPTPNNTDRYPTSSNNQAIINSTNILTLTR